MWGAGGARGQRGHNGAGDPEKGANRYNSALFSFFHSLFFCRVEEEERCGAIDKKEKTIDARAPPEKVRRQREREQERLKKRAFEDNASLLLFFLKSHTHTHTHRHTHTRIHMTVASSPSLFSFLSLLFSSLFFSFLFFSFLLSFVALLLFSFPLLDKALEGAPASGLRAAAGLLSAQLRNLIGEGGRGAEPEEEGQDEEPHP